VDKKITSLHKNIFIVSLFLFFTVLFTFPLILNLKDSVIDPGDPVLNAYILSWDTHALLNDPMNFFNANIFYPANLALTFSEHLLSNLLFFAPVYIITNNPLLSFNVTIIITIFLTGIFTYIFVKYITGNSYAAFISGFIFAFGPPKFAQISHFQLITMEWIPLALYFFERYLAVPKKRYIFLFSLVFILQLCSSYYLAYGFLVIASVYMLLRLMMNHKSLNFIFMKNITISLLMTGLIFIAITYPYIISRKVWGFKRSMDECIAFSADLFSYMSISTKNIIFLGHSIFSATTFNHEKILFPGIICLVLSIIAIKQKNQFKLPLLIGAISSFILSLGPFLQVNNTLTKIPLPYLVFYKLIPGFSSMRVPSRFGLMVFFILSILSGIGIKAIYEKTISKKKFILIFALLIVGIFAEYWCYPYPVTKFEFSKSELNAYKWVKGHGDSAVIEYPVILDNSKQDINCRYMLGSTIHWKPIVNGYSGFTPSTYYEIAQNIKEIPGEEDLEFFRGIGVNTVVLHRDKIPKLLNEYQSGNYSDIAKEIDFGDIKILELKEMFLKEGTDKIKIKMPESMIAGELMTLEGEIDGPFRRTNNYPEIIFKFIPKNSGKKITIKKIVPLPLYVPEGKKHKFGILLDLPKNAGEYNIKLLCNQKKYTIALLREFVKLVEFKPLSNNSPDKLKSELYVSEKEKRARPDELIEIIIKTLNKGDAVWLSSGRNDHGRVSVGYRILDEGQKEITGGRSYIPYDVYPGEESIVKLVFQAPENVGNYTLKLDMVSEYVTWFEQQGSKPLFIKIAVKQ